MARAIQGYASISEERDARRAAAIELAGGP